MHVIVTEWCHRSYAHFFKKKGEQEAFMLKVDLAKALDMIEWSVVLDALQHKGFHSHF